MRKLAILLLLLACAPAMPAVWIAAGSYEVGSDRAERDWGYAHSGKAAKKHRWYDRWEQDPEGVPLSRFQLDRHPVTQREYAAFVRETERAQPHISELAYRKQGFLAHSYAEVRPYLWRDGAPPGDRLDHPVVLVSREDAGAFCDWRGKRLPSEFEWEAACRGSDGRRFPWGNDWRPHRVHHATTGTAAVKSPTEPDLELMGNVFEWTASDFDARRAALKGCSWDDAPGTCRCAFRHGRPPVSRHILIGFRCAESGGE